MTSIGGDVAEMYGVCISVLVGNGRRVDPRSGKKIQRKTPEVKESGETPDCHHLTPFSGSRPILVLMLLRQFNRVASPSWISRVPSAMPLRAKVTNPAFRAAAMVHTPFGENPDTQCLLACS